MIKITIIRADLISEIYFLRNAILLQQRFYWFIIKLYILFIILGKIQTC